MGFGFPPGTGRTLPLLCATAVREPVEQEMTRRILIVDDHAGFRRSAARSLVTAGWKVVGEAEDGTAALDEAERCNPDVVVLDVGLPDISGIEVARLLHERLPDVAVVMISTQDRSDYGDLAL